MGSRIPLTLSVKKLNAIVGGDGGGLQIKLPKGSTSAKTRPLWFASNNLPLNVLARERLKKWGLTNTGSSTRSFGFSAKATSLIARLNLTRRRRKRRWRGRILRGTVALIHRFSKVGGRIGKNRVSDEEEEESSKDSIPSELRSTWRSSMTSIKGRPLVAAPAPAITSTDSISFSFSTTSTLGLIAWTSFKLPLLSLTVISLT